MCVQQKAAVAVLCLILPIAHCTPGFPQERPRQESDLPKLNGIEFASYFVDFRGNLRAASGGSVSTWKSYQMVALPDVSKQLEFTKSQQRQVQGILQKAKEDIAAVAKRRQHRLAELAAANATITQDDLKVFVDEIAEIVRRSEDEIQAVFLPHQIERLRQITTWLKIRLVGLKFLLCKGEMKDRLKLSSSEIKSVESKAAKLAESSRKKIANFERKSFDKILNVFPHDLRRTFNKRIELAKSKGRHPSIDAFLHFGAISDGKKQIGYCAQQRNLNTTLSGNPTFSCVKISSGFYTNPVASCLSDPEFRRELELDKDQEKHFQKLEAQLKKIFHDDYRQLLAELGSAELAEKMIAEKRNSLQQEMVELLLEFQRDKIEVIQFQRLVRSNDPLKVITLVADREKIELPESSKKKASKAMSEIVEEIRGVAKELEHQNEKELLDALTPENRIEILRLLGDKPAWFGPWLDRQMLDFSDSNER